jgi:hypothetical protein
MPHARTRNFHRPSRRASSRPPIPPRRQPPLYLVVLHVPAHSSSTSSVGSSLPRLPFLDPPITNPSSHDGICLVLLFVSRMSDRWERLSSQMPEEGPSGDNRWETDLRGDNSGGERQVQPDKVLGNVTQWKRILTRRRRQCQGTTPTAGGQVGARTGRGSSSPQPRDPHLNWNPLLIIQRQWWPLLRPGIA